VLESTEPFIVKYCMDMTFIDHSNQTYRSATKQVMQMYKKSFHTFIHIFRVTSLISDPTFCKAHDPC